MSVTEDTQSEIVVKRVGTVFRALAWFIVVIGTAFLLGGLASLGEADAGHFILIGLGLAFTLLGIYFVEMKTNMFDLVQH